MSIPRSSWLAPVAAAGVFAGTNVWYLRRMISGPGSRFSLFARRLYNFDTLVFPAGLAASAASFRPKGTGAAFSIAGALVAARVYATHIEPRVLAVRRIRISTPKLDRPVRILHITDMETDAVRSQEAKVIDKARELNPDLIFHTGDLLAPVEPATYESELPKMAEVWSAIEPPLGKLAVAGEVDLPILGRLLRGIGGLKALDGDAVILEAPGLRLNVLGLTFEQSCNDNAMEVRHVVTEWLDSAGPRDFTILIGHRPDYILTAQDYPIDLCLAGHTHGGQIQVPMIGPLMTHSRVSDDLARGFHEVGQTRLNVSAGVGFEHGHHFPAVRVNCPPEMTLIELIPERDEP